MAYRFFIETYNPVYYNLALDHALTYLLSRNCEIISNKPKVVVRLWRNTEKCIILGRSQSLKREVNEKYCKKHNIIISRRISGGGAVYQDKGTLNVSCVIPTQFLPHRDFKANLEFFTALIQQSLTTYYQEHLEDQVEFKPKFSIRDHTRLFFQNQKIAGAAGYTSKQYLLYHISLLVNTNMYHLHNSLLARDKGYNVDKPASSINHDTRNLPSKFKSPTWQYNLQSELTRGLSLGTVKLVKTPSLKEEQLTQHLVQHMYSKNEWLKEKQRLLLGR